LIRQSILSASKKPLWVLRSVGAEGAETVPLKAHQADAVGVRTPCIDRPAFFADP
jgi:hypothetical protein